MHRNQQRRILPGERPLAAIAGVASYAQVATPCPKPGLVQLAKDVVFASPSAAGSIVYGRASANGRTVWKTKTGQTLGDWEQGQTADA